MMIISHLPHLPHQFLTKPVKDGVESASLLFATTYCYVAKNFSFSDLTPCTI